MPELDKMKCNVCDDIFPAEELAAHEGMCIACADVMDTLAAKDDQGVLDDEGGLASEEMRKAIERYRKRKEYQAKYNERPAAKEARKAYNKNRQERDRMLIKKAKDLGLLCIILMCTVQTFTYRGRTVTCTTCCPPEGTIAPCTTTCL